MSKIKKRAKKTKTEEQKLLKKVRDASPVHVIEVELEVEPSQDWKLQRIQEQLRIIRNTVLGEIYKKYKQMVRTKFYKQTMKEYVQILKAIEKEKGKDEHKLKILEKNKKEYQKIFEELRDEFNITWEYTRKYGESLRTKFDLPDAVTVLSVCENVWDSIEGLLFRSSKEPYFYKKRDKVTMQGKQAVRSVILKLDGSKDMYFVKHNEMVSTQKLRFLF